MSPDQNRQGNLSTWGNSQRQFGATELVLCDIQQSGVPTEAEPASQSFTPSRIVFFSWQFSQQPSSNEVRAVFIISPHATRAARLLLPVGVDTPPTILLAFLPGNWPNLLGFKPPRPSSI